MKVVSLGALRALCLRTFRCVGFSFSGCVVRFHAPTLVFLTRKSDANECETQIRFRKDSK